MKKRLWLLPFLLLIPLSGLAAEPVAGADQILGLWVTDKGAAHVEIYREQGAYHGRVVWLAEPLYPAGDAEAGQPKHDRNNPDPALRAAPVIGLQIMRGFQAAAEGRWQGGTIYDPENGETYSCKLWLTDDGTLKVRGYVGISLFGRTAEWMPLVGANMQSVEPVPPAEAHEPPPAPKDGAAINDKNR